MTAKNKVAAVHKNSHQNASKNKITEKSTRKGEKLDGGGELVGAELRHYEPEFSINDPKWMVLGKMHVQVRFLDDNSPK
jgi:hypothetical protein